MARANPLALAIVVGGLLLAGISANAQDEAKEVVKEAPPAPKTGEFEIIEEGIQVTRLLVVLNRYGHPGNAATVQEYNRLVEEDKRIAKLKAKAPKKDEPQEEKKKSTPWTIYVPKDYDPAIPFGVIAFVNSGENAAVIQEYKPVLDKHRLIWISAGNSGNDAANHWRMAAALEGIRRLREKMGYNIDPDRIYVSGTSGGARIASNVSMLFSDVVSGGIYFAGINIYRDATAQPGNLIFNNEMPGMTPAMLAQAKQRRHVLIFGDKDNVAGYVPMLANIWGNDGFKYFHYFKIPDLAHTMPAAEVFEKAVLAVDAPLKLAAKGHYDTAATSEKRDGLGRAMEGYTKAAAHGRDEPFAAEAKTKAVELKAQYIAAVAELETLLESDDTKAFNADLAKFRRTWEPAGNEDAKRLAEKLKNKPKKK